MKRRKKEKGVVCKLDMEKAYDRVDWDFLFWFLRNKGLGDKWISWMEGCITDTYFSILLNGTSKGFFKALRGLRQGNPLSPFLFTLVVDDLSSILRRAEERWLVEGFVIRDDRIMVPHLQFTDDIILFLKVGRDNIKNAERCLKIF